MVAHDSPDTFALTQAAPSELSYGRELLDTCGLPTADVTAEMLYIATVDGVHIGVGGLEQSGSVGLLRSIAIDPAYQGNGYGVALCSELEQVAMDAGITQLFLLTTTAAHFFQQSGYTQIDREMAPPVIQQTTQFSELCPQQATCLRKQLSAASE
ncbi:GNAT family N-acetyltransferase [Halorubraceae archaeon YAN]|nr:GNAT family N-acetyltransferase [Halorubraceae archaeon YAN]